MGDRKRNHLKQSDQTPMTPPWKRDPRQVDRVEPVKRLSVNLPESLHMRFKTVCSATNRRMVSEIVDLVEGRTAELEEEAGLWRSRDDVRARRLDAVEQALACNHPTGDIEEMLADIERGRDLR